MDHSQHSIQNHEHHMSNESIHHIHGAGHSTESPSHDMNHMNHAEHKGMDHMMSMVFHFGYNEVILFSQWQTNSVISLIGSMIAIFIMATLYEGLKYYREYLFWKTYNLLEYRPVATPGKVVSPEDNSNPQTVHYVGEVIHKQPPSMFSLMHFYQTFLHLIQVTLSFLLMLIFMTFNVWLCLAVVLGAGVGYFLFCWKKSVIVDVTEHCH